MKSILVLLCLISAIALPVNGELIQHSWQAENVEHGTDVVHKDHHIHIEKSPHLSDDSVEYEHQAFEFIEVPDSVNEIALKAKTYADAQNFAKKFGFKNLGRVSTKRKAFVSIALAETPFSNRLGRCRIFRTPTIWCERKARNAKSTNPLTTTKDRNPSGSTISTESISWKTRCL